MGSGGGGCGNTTFDMPKLTLVLPTGLLTANDTVTNEYSLFTPPQGDAVMFVICTVVLLMEGTCITCEHDRLLLASISSNI